MDGSDLSPKDEELKQVAGHDQAGAWAECCAVQAVAEERNATVLNTLVDDLDQLFRQTSTAHQVVNATAVLLCADSGAMVSSQSLSPLRADEISVVRDACAKPGKRTGPRRKSCC